MPNKTQKIALAVPSFSGGGAERVMIVLANKFVEWGYSVDFIVGVNKGPYKELLNSNVNKVILSQEKAGYISKRLFSIYTIWRYLNHSDSCVLMSTIREFNVFIACIKLFSLTKQRIYLREAASLDISHFNGSLSKKIKLFLMRFFYNRCDGVIANSNATKEDLKEFLLIDDVKIQAIYNPMEKRVFERRRSVASIISAGRLVSNKNFSDVIKSIPLVKKEYPNVKLKILGEGPEKYNLLNLIKQLNLSESVEMVGFVDNPYEYYSTANVFVQTSLWEGFGYVLVEAMACGTPVVAYDSKGAMREILGDSKYGLLTPVGDLQALADAIIQQIEKPTSLELLSEAVERFDVDRIAREYLNAMGVK